MTRKYLQSKNVLPCAAAIFLRLVVGGHAQAIDFCVLAVNDFHGRISEGQKIGDRPVGGAAVLASYLKSEIAGREGRAVIAEVGDLIGASEPASSLLRDEPAIMFINCLGNATGPGQKARTDPFNDLVGCLGNHEFDGGTDELLRILNGGNHAKGPFLEDPWKGAQFQVTCANALNKKTGTPLVCPFVVKNLKNSSIRVAFIGAVLKATPSMVSADGIKDLVFVDEAQAINQQVKFLRENLGIHTFIVLLHQGDCQAPYPGQTDSAKTLANGALKNIVFNLDDDVDVVCAAHTHCFLNALVPNSHGVKILVTQAFAKGTAYARIDLKIDTLTKDVIAKTARIITAYGDSGPGLTPDSAALALVQKAKTMVAPLTNRIIGKSPRAVLAKQNSAGESALGDAIADAQRSAMGTDFAFMNPGGIRADLDSGTVTWGELYTIQPFGDYCVSMDLSGSRIYDALNAQWADSSNVKMLQISGLRYSWDAGRPVNSRVVDIQKNGASIKRDAVYSVTVNSFLASGGDNFSVFKAGTNRKNGPQDPEALVDYLSKLPQPFAIKIDGRILRRN